MDNCLNCQQDENCMRAEGDNGENVNSFPDRKCSLRIDLGSLSDIETARIFKECAVLILPVTLNEYTKYGLEHIVTGN